MDGYYFVHTHRSGKSGGGVGLYVASNLEYKSRNDLAIEDTACAESLFVEISRPKGENVVVGVIYRPPNQNIDEFIIFLNSLTAKISKENKLFYLMGDFNLNLMNHHCHQLTSEFLDIMYSNMFSPLITHPTRITSNTATLIDNIFTNHLDNLAFSGLLFTDISDPLSIFCILYEQHIDTNYDKYIFYPNKSEANISKFHDRLRNTNWLELQDFNDPKHAYGSFLDKFTNIFNSCFPLEKKRASRFTLKKPWLSKGLLKSIKRKNYLYKKYLTTPNHENESLYKKYKNKLTHSLHIAKRRYFEEKLLNILGNLIFPILQAKFQNQ